MNDGYMSEIVKQWVDKALYPNGTPGERLMGLISIGVILIVIFLLVGNKLTE